MTFKQLLLQENNTQIESSTENIQVLPSQGFEFIAIVKADSFESVSGSVSLSEAQLANLPEFFKNLYAAIREGGWIDLQLGDKTEEVHKQVTSLAKMVGFDFLSVQTNDVGVKVNGKKPKFTKEAGPAKIRRRKPKAIEQDAPTEANPWANLDQNESN